MSMIPELPLATFRFQYLADDSPALPRFSGSAWRGALGHALKKTVCVVRDTACPQCMLFRSCVYPYIFETPPPSGSEKMRRYPSAPHPFVIGIEPGQSGRAYRLGLTAFGRAYQYLPYLIHALEKAGHKGIGGKPQRFELQAVEQLAAGIWTTIFRPGHPLAAESPTSPEPPEVPAKVRITLETPLRLRRDDKIVTLEHFQFADLFGSLLRRISLLTYFHTDIPWKRTSPA
jgi:hypothetical protein